MKRALVILGTSALFFIAAQTCQAQVQSYRIAVHIPAIAGVNVPLDDPNAEIRPAELPQGLMTDIRQVVRAGETITLQTILLR